MNPAKDTDIFSRHYRINVVPLRLFAGMTAIQLQLPDNSGLRLAMVVNLGLAFVPVLDMWLLMARAAAPDQASATARVLIRHFAVQHQLPCLQPVEYVCGQRRWLWLANVPGKPAFNISISHSQQQVVVALIRGPMFGIDLELRPVSAGIVQRQFSGAENSWLASLFPADRPATRQMLWQLKEARIKACQLGLLAGLRHNMQPAYLSIIPVHGP